MKNGLKKGVSFQCLLSSWSKNFKLRIIKKCQSLNSLLALHKLHKQVNIFGFTFLDLLIKFMKMRRVYILYCPPPPPLQHDGNDLLIPWPLYMCCFTGTPPPPPSCLPIGWRTDPSRSHVFGRRRERGKTSITPLHAGWQRAQKDPCISHVDASHGEWPRIESSLLFCNFFLLSKSLRKSYFGFTRKKTSKTRNRYFFWFF